MKVRYLCFGLLFFLLTVFLHTMEISAEKDLGKQRIEAWSGVLCEADGFGNAKSLIDSNRATYTTAGDMNELLIAAEGGINGIYIEFDRIPQPWKLEDVAGGMIYDCGKNGFLHDYTDVKILTGNAPETLRLTFAPGTVIADIYALQTQAIPDFVQVWEPPCERADLLLVSSHSDDEQLFFAGLLPLYAGEKQLSVQVAYVVQHFEANGIADHVRSHEQLDGLWTVGVRNYPVMSDFPDLYAESKNREIAFDNAIRVYEQAGITYEDFKGYLTECIRRFQPLVVVSHDFGGEYGHGTHVVCANALKESIHAATDETLYPESADEYGTWQVSKAYSHLYKENTIYMDYDTPLDYFQGKTAFEVTQEGFGCHQSQHWTWFYKWIYGKEGQPITKATQITTYSPCEYGLYYTMVGPDIIGGDFMENIETYEDRKAVAEEHKLAIEAWAEQQRAAAVVRKSQMETPAIAPEVQTKESGMSGLPWKVAGMGVLAVIGIFVAICVIHYRKQKNAD